MYKNNEYMMRRAVLLRIENNKIQNRNTKRVRIRIGSSGIIRPDSQLHKNLAEIVDGSGSPVGCRT